MNRGKIETAAFEVWQAMNNAQFHVLMAHKYGTRHTLQNARDHLAKAVAIADAALSEAAVEGEDA